MLPGTLCKIRGAWALRVADDGDFQGVLYLEGERAGEVYPLGTGIVRALAIVEPFGWFPMVPDHLPTVDAQRTRSLTLSASGPVLVGENGPDDSFSDYTAFGLDGRRVERHDDQAMRFPRWAVELCHKDRPFTSLATLLQIDSNVRP